MTEPTDDRKDAPPEGAAKPKPPPRPPAAAQDAKPTDSETETLRIGPATWADVTFTGPVDQTVIRGLIAHYEAMLNVYPPGEEPDDAAAEAVPARRKKRR